MKKLVIALAGVAIIGTGAYIGYEHVSSKDNVVDSDIQVAPEQSETDGSSSEVNNSKVDDVAQSQEKASSGSQDQTDQTGLDNTYPVVLVFADGTRRLAKTPPTSQFWQQGTSSSYGNGHLGRTSYNQKQPQLGGARQTKEDEAKMKAEFDKIVSDYYDDDAAMKQQSVPDE